MLSYLIYILAVTLLTDSKNKDFDFLRQASVLNYAFIPVCFSALLLVVAELLKPSGPEAEDQGEPIKNILQFLNYLFWGWTFVLGIIAHSGLNRNSVYRSAIILLTPILIVGFIVFSVGSRMKIF